MTVRGQVALSRAVKSSGVSSRMCSALMLSAFFWSNLAGLELTLATSNAATISARLNTS